MKIFNLKLIAAIFSIVFLLTLCISINPSLAKSDSTWKEIKKRNSVRMGVIQSEPWFYKDPKTQEWSGFCVKIGKAIADAMGVKLVPVETTWGNAIAALHANQIDVMFALDATPKRAVAIDFVETPLIYYALSTYVKKGIQAKTWSDLNNSNVKLAVTMGTSFDREASALLPQATIGRYPSNDETVASFQSGRANAFCMWQPALIMYSRKVGGGNVIIPSDPIRYGTTSAGVRREADKTWRDYLNVCIAFYYNTGRIQSWWDETLKTKGIDPALMPPVMKELWK